MFCIQIVLLWKGCCAWLRELTTLAASIERMLCCCSTIGSLPSVYTLAGNSLCDMFAAFPPYVEGKDAI